MFMGSNKTSTTRWQYQPLSEEDISQIHEKSMQTLEEVGFEVQQEEAFEMFKKAGANVEHESRIVRLKEDQVKDIISTVPSQLTLYGRDPKNNIHLNSGNVYFGTGGTALNVLNYDTGEQVPATLDDLNDIIRIVDKMDNVHLMLLPTYPNEVPFENVDVNRFYAGMKYTSKHIMGGVYTSKGIDDVIAMAEKVAGSAAKLREEPFISIITCGISPLRVDSKYGSYAMQVARQGIPVAVPVEPLCGATAPVTLAGTLVIQNCDGLIHMMLTQLANPGAPAIYGSVATSVDLLNVKYLGGPVESGMINAATAQLARHYGFPYYSTAGISDSKTLDAQCGYESAVNNLLVGLAGGDFIHDAAGLMEFATTVSKEKIVIDNDILGMVSRSIKGINVNEDTMAFSSIKNAGPGGNFIAERHTRRFMKKEHYKPTISDRQSREDWTAQGSKTAAERAHEKVLEILGSEPELYIDKDIENDLTELYPKIRITEGVKS